MRPAKMLFIFFLLLLAVDGTLYIHARHRQSELDEDRTLQKIAVSGLGLTDLCVATEARYTRHPSVSDPIAPFMDHPGAIEHFPTGSFWNPPTNTASSKPIQP